MSINSGKSSTDAELDANMETDGRTSKNVLEYDNDETTAFVRKLLLQMCAKAETHRDKQGGNEASRSMSTALKLGESMWGITEERWQAKANAFVRTEPKEPAQTEVAKNAETVVPRTRKVRPKLHAYTEYSHANEKACSRS